MITFILSSVSCLACFSANSITQSGVDARFNDSENKAEMFGPLIKFKFPRYQITTTIIPDRRETVEMFIMVENLVQHSPFFVSLFS